MQRSSPSVHHHAGVTDMLIYRMFTRRRARSPRRSLSLPSSLPSRVPVGTGDEVERIIRELRPDIDVAVVSNPEFLREGAAIHDFKHPDRIVIGTDDERAKRVLAEIYRPL